MEMEIASVGKRGRRFESSTTRKKRKKTYYSMFRRDSACNGAESLPRRCVWTKESVHYEDSGVGCGEDRIIYERR